jgi:hypothetical protein
MPLTSLQLQHKIADYLLATVIRDKNNVTQTKKNNIFNFPL